MKLNAKVAITCVPVGVTAVTIRRLRAPAKHTAWIDNPWVDANGWAVGHFVHYALLGFIKTQSPLDANGWALCMLGFIKRCCFGVLWSVLEAFLADLRMPRPWVWRP